MPSSPGTIIAERFLAERDGCQVSLAQLDDGSRVILRRTTSSHVSAESRLEGLAAFQRAGLPGFADILGTRLLQGGLEIREALV